MENRITIKVWEMDYSFLINNYLNPAMWQKKWTLFEYKQFKITLNIYSIQTKNEKLGLDIDMHYRGDAVHQETVWTSLKIDDINFLKRQINSAIFELIGRVELSKFIFQSDEYKDLQTQQDAERKRLTDIAHNFLKEHNVENENIVDAYTSAYISENEQVHQIMLNFCKDSKYQLLTDFYFIWLETLEQDDIRDARIKEITDSISATKLMNTLNELQEYKKYMETEEFSVDMAEKLEDI